jgi:hypothetical protein
MIMNRILLGLIYCIVNLHNGRLVTTAITVIGSRKDSDDTAVVLPLVALHDKLVSPGDEMKAVDVGELLGNVLAKRVASPAR